MSEGAEGTSSRELAAGTTERFRALYEAHHAPLYSYVVRRLTSSPGDVADVVAEIFTVAWRRFDAVPSPPDDRLWLYGVARRIVARHERTLWRRSRLVARLTDHAAVAEWPAPRSSDEARGAAVREAVARLRPADREVLALVLWEQLSHAEAAVVLGCSVNAVALRLHKARGRLRRLLAADRPDLLAPPEEAPGATATPIAGRADPVPAGEPVQPQGGDDGPRTA